MNGLVSHALLSLTNHDSDWLHQQSRLTYADRATATALFSHSYEYCRIYPFSRTRTTVDCIRVVGVVGLRVSGWQHYSSHTCWKSQAPSIDPNYKPKFNPDGNLCSNPGVFFFSKNYARYSNYRNPPKRAQSLENEKSITVMRVKHARMFSLSDTHPHTLCHQAPLDYIKATAQLQKCILSASCTAGGGKKVRVQVAGVVWSCYARVVTAVWLCHSLIWCDFL